MKSKKAITLISLVITIVVLIILASVAIYLSLGNNGIFTRAKEAREATNKQTATEKINLKITTAQMNKYAEKQVMPTLKELSLVLKEDSEIQYVTEKSKKLASAEYDVTSESPSSIFTKLNKYPYEFEINGQLQLASIDGVKVATNNNQQAGNFVGFPDYTNREVITSNTEYVAEQNMYIILDTTGFTNKSYSSCTVNINDVQYSFYQGYDGVDHYHITNSIIPIKKGTKYKIVYSGCTAYKVKMIY